MPSKRTLLGAAAFSVALAGGGIAGAVLGTPSVSSAQDGTTSTTAKDGTTDTKAADANRPRRPHPRLEVLRQAADALGMTPAELRTELQSGKSIADVAKEKGVDEQKVIDAIVSDATAKLQAEIQKLPDQVTKAVERDGLPQRPEGGPRDGKPPADAPATDSSS
jgi:hypothetical protein